MKNTQPEWVAEILRLIESVKTNYERAEVAFNEYASKNGIPEAIIWHGEALAITHEQWRQVKKIGVYLMDRKEDTPAEAAGKILHDIAQRRKDLIDNLRVGGSTCQFSNTVANAQLDARARMFSTYGGTFHMIEHICKDELQKGEAK